MQWDLNSKFSYSQWLSASHQLSCSLASAPALQIWKFVVFAMTESRGGESVHWGWGSDWVECWVAGAGCRDGLLEIVSYLAASHRASHKCSQLWNDQTLDYSHLAEIAATGNVLCSPETELGPGIGILSLNRVRASVLGLASTRSLRFVCLHVSAILTPAESGVCDPGWAPGLAAYRCQDSPSTGVTEPESGCRR